MREFKKETKLLLAVIGIFVVVLFVALLFAMLGDSDRVVDEGSGVTGDITVRIDIDPPFLEPGQTHIIQWSSENAARCSGVNFQTNGATSGSASVTPNEPTQYDLICDNDTDFIVETYTLRFIHYPYLPDPSVSLSASSLSVRAGNPVILTWTSENSPQCSSAQFSTEGATSGSAVVTPTVSTTYTIDCIQPGEFSSDITRVASDSVTVEVAL